MLDLGSETLVLTHDAMAEGVHFLPGQDAADIAWKLVATNLSDLAAKGAEPLGVLLGYQFGADDARFLAGLDEVLGHFGVPLLGGDTIGGAGPQVLGLTSLGRATHRPVPARSGAKIGDGLWITGPVGAAMLGFEALRDGSGADSTAFRRPLALLAEGRALAPHVTAMMDVSDGLLIDADRMARASGCDITLMLEAVPLSAALLAVRPDVLDTRLAAATAGDDYQLLFAADPGEAVAIREIGAGLGIALTPVGHAGVGEGLTLIHKAQRIVLPERLGFTH